MWEALRRVAAQARSGSGTYGAHDERSAAVRFCQACWEAGGEHAAPAVCGPVAEVPLLASENVPLACVPSTTRPRAASAQGSREGVQRGGTHREP